MSKPCNCQRRALLRDGFLSAELGLAGVRERGPAHLSLQDQLEVARPQRQDHHQQLKTQGDDR